MVLLTIKIVFSFLLDIKVVADAPALVFIMIFRSFWTIVSCKSLYETDNKNVVVHFIRNFEKLNGQVLGGIPI